MSSQDDTPLEDLPDQIIIKYAEQSQLGLYVRGTRALGVNQMNLFHSTVGFGRHNDINLRLHSYDVCQFYQQAPVLWAVSYTKTHSGDEVNLVWRPAPRISVAKILFYLVSWSQSYGTAITFWWVRTGISRSGMLCFELMLKHKTTRIE